VDNQQVAQVLAEIADLLEIKGENVFKICRANLRRNRRN